MSNPTMQSELEQFKKTGNSTHARWIANELIKAQADSKFANIEKQLDVTVGHASGGDIKSGLLWAVIDHVEAKNHLLIKSYIEIISHATYGKMNKAYTDISQVKAVIDDSVNEIVEAERAEALRGYVKAEAEMDKIFRNTCERKQNVIMKEALMLIRNRGRHWPDAGDIAKNALDKAQEQGK